MYICRPTGVWKETSVRFLAIIRTQCCSPCCLPARQPSRLKLPLPWHPRRRAILGSTSNPACIFPGCHNPSPGRPYRTKEKRQAQPTRVAAGYISRPGGFQKGRVLPRPTVFSSITKREREGSLQPSSSCLHHRKAGLGGALRRTYLSLSLSLRVADSELFDPETWQARQVEVD